MTTKKVVTVTNGQGAQFMQMARGKGVNRARFQTALDDGTMGRVLDGIGAGLPITIGTPIIPPPGGRFHILTVPVVRDRDWQEAVNAAGPNTPADYNVHKVGDQYLPEGGSGKEELILLNFPSGGSWDKAIAWAGQFGLERTVPRQVFAIGEHKPKLHEKLGLNPMYVVATEECSFDGNQRACYVWWLDSERGADLDWVSRFGSSLVWFAFRRKIGTQNLVTGS